MTSAGTWSCSSVNERPTDSSPRPKNTFSTRPIRRHQVGSTPSAGSTYKRLVRWDPPEADAHGSAAQHRIVRSARSRSRSVGNSLPLAFLRAYARREARDCVGDLFYRRDPLSVARTHIRLLYAGGFVAPDRVVVGSIVLRGLVAQIDAALTRSRDFPRRPLRPLRPHQCRRFG